MAEVEDVARPAAGPAQHVECSRLCPLPRAEERGRFQIKDVGEPAWAHPVVSNGRLYVRNQNQLTAYDVRWHM